jgi:uncharacterized protein YecT (DUF1311 family)
MEPAMMKYKSIHFFFFIFLIIFSISNSVAQTQKNTNSVKTGDTISIEDLGYSNDQHGMDQMVLDDLKKADKELNKIYKEILEIYSNDTVFIKKLKIAQIAWIKFRDAHIESKFKSVPATYDTVYLHPCISMELYDLITSRIEELKFWLYEESDNTGLCRGFTAKTKEEIEKIRKTKGKK